MRKDLKTGMLVGTVVSLIAVVWFSVTQMAGSPPKPIIESFDIDIAQPASHSTETGDFVYQNKQQPQIPIEPVIEKPQVKPEPVVVKNTQTIHIVKSGQTLSDISKIYYNTTVKWKKIYLANKEKFPKGPDAIKVGMKLVIPE